ncbi:MerR family transcriptional regulator/heat shock protein HspR [Rarobacter incanus]|uniref:MerR family transcriptional regulator/heat shock protein HspR n=2 Tax=Rarobacter incanus TaxID=153494 RepID=A0A542SPD4_9MICO|nr:helix-turn-helix transcriptional regulator [Rarobacter incanus]TQK76480.1 MerR family transcriptional regulator/heat shock protein HspR [Rarobacter incanus]
MAGIPSDNGRGGRTDEFAHRAPRITEEQLNEPLFVISRAAELAGMHPQTLRQYDRTGLVTPRRTAGRGRRYSLRDIATLREIQRMSQEEGINLAGIRRILALESEVTRLRGHIDLLLTREPGSRIFSAGSSGNVVVVRKTRTQRESGTVVVRGALGPSRGQVRHAHRQGAQTPTNESNN